MLERFVHAVSTTDIAAEDIAVTRERLKDRFPRGATRRMTQLGMLVGAALENMGPRADDAVVYASAYAESRALEGYLDSFPAASPTLFQTSIHPSAVQQALIGRQFAISEFLPITGRGHLAAQAVQAALLCAAPRVLLCGGEERGTWLLDHRQASDRGFSFAVALSQSPDDALGRVTLEPTDEPATELLLPAFFDLLAARQPIDRVALPGQRLVWQWR